MQLLAPSLAIPPSYSFLQAKLNVMLAYAINTLFYSEFFFLHHFVCSPNSSSISSYSVDPVVFVCAKFFSLFFLFWIEVTSDDVPSSPSIAR
jgi:hypothetical protein